MTSLLPSWCCLCDAEVHDEDVGFCLRHWSALPLSERNRIVQARNRARRTKHPPFALLRAVRRAQSLLASSGAAHLP